jgi:hydroxymethylglutaryl-CoA lyase
VNKFFHYKVALMSSIVIEEQGLRDGLQSLSEVASLDQKIAWLDQLVDAGLKRIQIGSFVNPKLVPTMADTAELYKLIGKISSDVVISALVLNVKGVERAIEAGANHLAISLSASDTHSLKNTGKNIEESKSELISMIKLAKEAKITVRGGIQCAFGCRYEGEINESVLQSLIDLLLSQNVDELVLADSTGMGHPDQISKIMIQTVANAGDKPTGLHLHNTENKGYANLYAGIKAGVKIFDTAFGGLGGCPFIKGATGNIATEDVVHLCKQMGIETNIDITKVAKVSDEVEEWLGVKLPGYLYKLITYKELKFT